MGAIDHFALTVGTQLWNIVVGLAMFLGVYIGIRSRFIQFRLFPEAFRQVKAQVKAGRNKDGVTGLQAFLVTLGGCIGTGNVAGVAMALIVGGPGVVPWMWVIALLGAGTSFVENTLSQTYKIREGSEFRGGPAYYMWKAAGKRWLGTFYAFVMIISLGFVLVGLQTNTIVVSANEAFHLPHWITAAIISALIALIIFGGIKRIADVADKGVPIMTVVYVAMLLLVIIFNYKEIPWAFGLIFKQAVSAKAITGASFGMIVIQGVKRGVFSSGAGHGDAPTTGASATVSHPAKQGMLATLAVYTDTCIVCTATALVIIFADAWSGTGYVGAELSEYAFVVTLGKWVAPIFALCILMFCFTSIMANYYCGETSLAYLSHGARGRNIYRICFVGSVFLGGITEVTVMWDIADMFLAIMIITNMITLIFLAGKGIAVGNDYIKQKKEGKDPVFVAADLGLENTECWPETTMKTEEKANIES